jgi:ribose transport system substrate-binding protein
MAQRRRYFKGRPTRPLALITGMTLLAGLGACSSSGSTAPPSGGSSSSSGGTTAQKTIAFAGADGADPFFAVVKCAAEAAAAKNNVKLHWQFTNSVDIGPELQTLEAALQTKPNGVVFDPFDPTAFEQTIRTAMSSGVPVVTIDGSDATKVEVAHFGTNNVAAGALGGNYMGKILNGKGTVAVVSFSPSVPVEVDRVTGFVDALKKNYPGITILPIQYGGADAGKSATIMAAELQAHPNISGIYGTDDADAVGAASAVAAAGDKGKIKVIAYDATQSEVQALKNGTFDALIGQNPYEEGYQAVQLLAKILNGQVSQSSVAYQQYTPAGLVTPANLNDPATQNFIYSPHC